MSEHVYKSVELTGSSKMSADDAIRNAISRASKTIHKLRWFQVGEARCVVEKGAVACWQLTMKVGFTLDE